MLLCYIGVSNAKFFMSMWCSMGSIILGGGNYLCKLGRKQLFCIGYASISFKVGISECLWSCHNAVEARGCLCGVWRAHSNGCFCREDDIWGSGHRSPKKSWSNQGMTVDFLILFQRNIYWFPHLTPQTSKQMRLRSIWCFISVGARYRFVMEDA